MKKSFLKILIILFSVIYSSCEKMIKTEILKEIPSTIKYAKGFDIINEKGTKKLLIKSAYQNSKELFSYQILNKDKKGARKALIDQEILVPINRIVVTSTTHIPMIELLNEEASIVGFPNSNYISSEKTRHLIDKGNITEIGKESSLNTEILLDLHPELVVGFGVSSVDKTLTSIQKAGINVIYNGDWLEESPLGRAEWIKFLGFYLIRKNKQIVFLRL